MSSLMTDESRVVRGSIVEAIVDIDCDLPPAMNVLDLEGRAQERLWVEYPEVRRVTDGVTALQFVTADGKQIVQFRAEGYSFNALERDESARIDLPEIEITWQIFRDLAAPVQIRGVTLRRIHRFLFPLARMSELRGTLQFDGFVRTGHRVNATLVVQPPVDDTLAVIADIESTDPAMRATDDWPGLQEAILSLDRLTDRVYEQKIPTWLNLP